MACGQLNRVPSAAAGTPRCGRCREPLPWLVDAGDGDYAEVVEASRMPVLVDLWAPWCGPCRAVAPVVEQAAREFAGRLKVVKVNVDEATRVAGRLGAQSIPTLLIVRDGTVIARQVGAPSGSQLLAWVRRSMTASAGSGGRSG
jgi:thioredoxin 2